VIEILTSVSSPIYYLIKGNYGLDIQREIRRGEGSLHPQPEGWGIRDPLRSRSNKSKEKCGNIGK